MFRARSVPNSQSTAEQDLRSGKSVECKHYLVTTDTETVKTSHLRVTEGLPGPEIRDADILYQPLRVIAHLRVSI